MEGEGRLSPDGRWWWDGSGWRPAAERNQPVEPRPPTWHDRVAASVFDLAVRRAADWRVLLAVAAMAVITDAAVRAPRDGLAATLAVVVAAAGLVATRRVAGRQALA